MIPKRVLKKYLYEFRVPLSYKNCIKNIEACLKDEPLIPKTTGSALMGIKRALEAYRKKEGQTTKMQVEAEQSLVERAAELGSKSAISLLCYSRLSDPNCSIEDRADGSRLLRELIDMEYALAFKVSADLAYKLDRPEAIELYQRALELPGLDPKVRTECWRSIGHIEFKSRNLIQARRAFSNACEGAVDLSQVSDCHFYLAQLRESNREVSREHLQIAASLGLSDAFTPLGMLLLNYFNDPHMARRWLELALTTDSSGAAHLGLLDVASCLDDSKLGQAMVYKIQKHKNYDELAALRPDALARFQPRPTPKAVVGKGRWSV